MDFQKKYQLDEYNANRYLCTYGNTEKKDAYEDSLEKVDKQYDIKTTIFVQD